MERLDDRRCPKKCLAYHRAYFVVMKSLYNQYDELIHQAFADDIFIACMEAADLSQTNIKKIFSGHFHHLAVVLQTPDASDSDDDSNDAGPRK